MGKSKIFDNIMQMIATRITLAGTATQSVEIDLELPRGYIAKIKKIRVDWRNVFDLIVSTDECQLSFLVLLDPDDAVNTLVPADTVEHDAIWGGSMQVSSLEAGPDAMWNQLTQEINFDQELDVVSARNLRFNILGDSAQVDGSVVQCQIWYTLEQIHDTQIMELLDIL